jgi:hypothetical protein
MLMPLNGNSRLRLHVVAVLLLALVAGRACYAHPMGNFSINHYAGIHVEKNSVEVLYIIDQAEIPTYQDMQDSGIVPQVGDASLPKYLVQQAVDWNKNIKLEINGEVVRLVPVSKSVIFPPGAGGLPTMKIGVLYRGVIRGSARTVHLHYLDENFAGHAGWKEIVVTAGEGVTLDAAQPFKVDRSAQLTNYPTNLLNSPPQDLEANFDYIVVVPAASTASSSVAGKLTPATSSACSDACARSDP